MPCGLERTTPSEDETFISYKDLARLEKKIARATRSACEMAALIRDRDKALPRGHKAITMFSRLSSKTKEWVKRHDYEDELRKKEEQRERLRKKALAKLTPEERKVLDL